VTIFITFTLFALLFLHLLHLQGTGHNKTVKSLHLYIASFLSFFSIQTTHFLPACPLVPVRGFTSRKCLSVNLPIGLGVISLPLLHKGPQKELLLHTAGTISVLYPLEIADVS
jgi:hypothetical protein